MGWSSVCLPVSVGGLFKVHPCFLIRICPSFSQFCQSVRPSVHLKPQDPEMKTDNLAMLIWQHFNSMPWKALCLISVKKA